MPIAKCLARQARKPAGWFGRVIVARMFNKGNGALLEHVMEWADPRPGQRILEIGFGPGLLLRQLAECEPEAQLYGIDFSADMVRVAEKVNRNLLREGRLELKQASVEEIPYGDDTFDTVCSCNTLYFWPDPQANANEIRRVLKPGGRLLLGFRSKTQLDKIPIAAHGFTKYRADEVVALLEGAGFSQVEVRERAAKPVDSLCAVAVA